MGALLAYVPHLRRLRLPWRSYPALTGWAKFWHASGVFRGGKENVKTRTLENRKGAAPKFVLALHGGAARLGVAPLALAVILAFVPSPYGLG